MIADTWAYLSVVELGQKLQRLRKYERSKFILKQIASNYGSEKRTVCFQLWGANLVFAFIKVGQAQIFGCVCLKRKFIV